MKILVLALAALTAIPALADPKLAEKKNCLTCHNVAAKVIGPAFKDVAAKYAGQADAAPMLAGKIQKGSSGVWGVIPMPANDVSPTEANTLAEWVLSLK
jgi:cytochrome c